MEYNLKMSKEEYHEFKEECGKKYEDNAEKIIEEYKNFISNNNHIYLLAGELNPDFYTAVIKYLHETNDADRKEINIICGPYISVKDELFKRYYNVSNNHLGNWWFSKIKENEEWWKIHPVFQEAYDNDNINIYISKHRSRNHFCFGEEGNVFFIENPHEELEEGNLCVHEDDATKKQELLNIWNKIKEEKCYKWNKNVDKRLFKPIYKFKREVKLLKEIKKEFPLLEAS
jgi:hypothetical protein